MITRVAILTYHRSVNYGSALQAYGLNRYLNENFCYAVNLDYWPEVYNTTYYAYVRKFHGLLGKARTFLNWTNRKNNLLKIKKFTEFINNRLKITAKLSEQDLSSTTDSYDYYIVGSDQVWNSKCFEFSPVYYLDFVKNKAKCVSYAASTSATNIEQSPLFEKNLKDFKALSLREPDAAKKASEVLKRTDVQVCCDPVFLLEKQKWITLVKGSALKLEAGKYVFAYYLGDYSGMRKLGRRLARLYKLPLVLCNFDIRDIFSRAQKIYDSGPIDFLYLIYNSKAVISNSFHACAFSILFNKPFLVYGKNEVSNRTNNLLELIGEPWHSVGLESLSLTNEELERHLEIKGPHPKLEKLIAESKDYLARALKND